MISSENVDDRAPLARLALGPGRGYTGGMDREAVRAFVRRDRAAVWASKRAFHANAARGTDPNAGVVLGQGLREYASRVRPDWPTPGERAADLQHHVTLKRMLDRAAHAVTRR